MSAAARLRADPTTQFACDFIDKYFGDSDEWAVIHDLRFRVGSRALQLNHVLISNALDNATSVLSSVQSLYRHL